VQTFEEVRESGKTPDALLPEIVTGLSGPLASAGYILQTQSERVITFVRKFRPWFIWVGVVLLFPLGLLFLLYKETATITVVLEPIDGGGTRVRVNGKGEPDVRRAFEQMNLDDDQ
jgi:hypothetical protein